MHYYSFHIGDYRAATAHLTNEEDLAYRRLIDMYYDMESNIPLDTQWVSRRIRVAIQVVETVLKDMFELTENGWKSQRCDEEIARYRHNAEKNKLNGIKGGRPRKNPLGTQVEPNQKATINHKPLTINQEPITSSKSNKQRGSRLPDNWWPSAELENWAKAERPELDVGKTAEGFIDYWLSVPGQKGVKLDWDRTFKTWIRNQKATKGNKVENLKLTEHGERAVRVMDSWLKGKESENGQAKIC